MEQPLGCEAERLARAVFDEFRSSGRYPSEEVARLAVMALSTDAATAKAATRALFTFLIEPLADAFEGAAVSFYNRVFAQLTQACRATAHGREIGKQLDAWQLTTEAALFSRAERLRRPQRSRDSLARVKRAIVLSRVSLGAEVAITSVMIERLMRELPGAEIVLLGSHKAEELLGGDARLSFRAVDYERGGTLLERMRSWLCVVAVVRELTGDCASDEFLLLDPDSRLTQCGMLPLTADTADCLSANYLFFPSREYGQQTRSSVAELASDWLSDVFGACDPMRPRLRVREADRKTARELLAPLRRGGTRLPLVTVNFGIGGNPQKRLGADFEQGLLTSLIACGARVLFDRGSSQRADTVLKNLARGGTGQGQPVRMLAVAESERPSDLSALSDYDLLVWHGGLGQFSALIAESDLYVGYDSSGNHIAAALGTRCINVMAGYSSPRALERWRPTGTQPSCVIPVERQATTEEVLAKVMSQVRLLIDAAVSERRFSLFNREGDRA